MKFTKGQEFVAEFFGTLVLIAFGCGVCAMVALFGSNPPVGGDTIVAPPDPTDQVAVPAYRSDRISQPPSPAGARASRI